MKHTGKKQHPIAPEHRIDGTKVHLSADGTMAEAGYRGHAEGAKIKAKQDAAEAKLEASKPKAEEKPAPATKTSTKSSTRRSTAKKPTSD